MDYPKLPCVGLCNHWAGECTKHVSSQDANDCIKGPNIHVMH